jgi:hypothetical protein
MWLRLWRRLSLLQIRWGLWRHQRREWRLERLLRRRDDPP